MAKLLLWHPCCCSYSLYLYLIDNQPTNHDLGLHKQAGQQWTYFERPFVNECVAQRGGARSFFLPRWWCSVPLLRLPLPKPSTKKIKKQRHWSLQSPISISSSSSLLIELYCCYVIHIHSTIRSASAPRRGESSRRVGANASAQTCVCRASRTNVDYSAATIKTNDRLDVVGDEEARVDDRTRPQRNQRKRKSRKAIGRCRVGAGGVNESRRTFPDSTTRAATNTRDTARDTASRASRQAAATRSRAQTPTTTAAQSNSNRIARDTQHTRAP